MPRLRRSDTSEPGISRRRRGKGFAYFDPSGAPVRDPESLARIRELVIPPAWTDVWICPDPQGHIQALGTDVAGRRQYRYHDRWRARRDQAKFEHMIEFGHALPTVRRTAARHLTARGFSKERVLACAVRLLDLGFFRVGSEEYAEDNGTFGLATIQRRHVTVSGPVVRFDYRAKGGKRRVQSVADDVVAKIVRGLKKRAGGGPNCSPTGAAASGST